MRRDLEFRKLFGGRNPQLFVWWRLRSFGRKADDRSTIVKREQASDTYIPAKREAVLSATKKTRSEYY